MPGFQAFIDCPSPRPGGLEQGTFKSLRKFGSVAHDADGNSPPHSWAAYIYRYELSSWAINNRAWGVDRAHHTGGARLRPKRRPQQLPVTSGFSGFVDTAGYVPYVNGSQSPKRTAMAAQIL